MNVYDCLGSSPEITILELVVFMVLIVPLSNLYEIIYKGNPLASNSESIHEISTTPSFQNAVRLLTGFSGTVSKTIEQRSIFIVII